MTLALRDTVYGCISNGRAAFLDLETSTYFSAPEDLEPLLQKVIRQDVLDTGDMSKLQELVDEGLLVEMPSVEPRLRTSSIPACDLANTAVRLHWWEIAMACACQVYASAILRCLRLDQILHFLDQGDARLRVQSSNDLERIQRAATALRLSERIVSSNNKCLRRSLALIIYLSHIHIPAKLVIAVKMRPFGAHAWVQVDQTVINDALDNVRAFTPILVA